MRVLVTRPEEAARRTAARLSTLGHEPVLMPLFRPEYLVIPDEAPEPFSALALTSANAVTALEKAGAIELWRDLPVFTVGNKTAEAARNAGFRDIRSANGGGHKLAVLIRDQELDGTLCYFAGEPRSPSFEDGLEEFGIRFETRICYRMVPVTYSPETLADIFANPIDSVLLYSSETANRFFELLEKSESKVAPHTRFLCLSPNIAACVSSEFSSRSFAAAEPNEEQLFSLL